MGKQTGISWTDHTFNLVDPDGFDGAHDAMADVRATAAVLSKIDKGEGPRLIRSRLWP